MTKDELIVRLKIELDTMMGWAREVGDEYLDGDPDNRKRLVSDLAEAKEAMGINADI
jgi:hypothetical protein